MVSGTCAKHGVNIADITQTIMQEYFTMIMLVDASEASVPFAQLKEELAAAGEARNLDIRIQREDIFNAMHRI
jgi:ACT domain-containing protein